MNEELYDVCSFSEKGILSESEQCITVLLLRFNVNEKSLFSSALSSSDSSNAICSDISVIIPMALKMSFSLLYIPVRLSLSHEELLSGRLHLNVQLPSG